MSETQMVEFKSHNSPWTEMYHQQAQTPSMDGAMPATSPASSDMEEQQPTHDALADVYNRDYRNSTPRKRF